MKRLFLVTALAGSFLFCGNAFADATKVFNAKCASCHGKDGLGKTPMGEKNKSPDLTKSKMSEADITKVINDGKGKSPVFKGKIPDADIAEVAKLVKGLQK